VGPNPGEITEIFGPGGTVLGPLAFGQPAGWFTASGIFDGNRTRCNPFPNCNFFPTSIGSEISNVGLGVLTDAAISDTMTFRAETTNFYLFLTASAAGGNAFRWPNGNVSPASATTAFIDPIIRPDPSNPNIILTSDAGPNPNPDAALLDPSLLSQLSSSDLQDLARIGVLS
jgi:hypothetical protein